jgi:arsenite methyltransferase
MCDCAQNNSNGRDEEKLDRMKTNELKLDSVRKSVRGRYGKAVSRGSGCGCGSASGSPEEQAQLGDAAIVSRAVGYSADEVHSVPDGSNLGLGCGNPVAIASLRPGQTVLDLGSGGGFDAFLAAKAVGPNGLVIGVDMTPEMISKARQNKATGGYTNVEFRLGEIESLPVADGSVDVILSNCVINLSPDKARVFRDAFRVLKPGGRLTISDIVALAPIPDNIRKEVEHFTPCGGGAAQVEEVKATLRETGFGEIRVEPKPQSRELIREFFPGRGLENYFASATIEALKPKAA